ncbi:hypothetical protein BGZ49_004568 [Haplosporangium sp. Z 27]|nr:hypothetical protein BGZ49_004568 [Haplosporangium sp. Z 27]
MTTKHEKSTSSHLVLPFVSSPPSHSPEPFVTTDLLTPPSTATEVLPPPTTTTATTMTKTTTTAALVTATTTKTKVPTTVPPVNLTMILLVINPMVKTYEPRSVMNNGDSHVPSGSGGDGTSSASSAGVISLDAASTCEGSSSNKTAITIGADIRAIAIAGGLLLDPALLVSTWLHVVAPGLSQRPIACPIASLARPRSCDPMLPPYALLREERAQPPKPIKYNDRLYDVMGVSSKGELILRDQQAVHQDVRVEHFTGRPVMLDGMCWRAVSLEVTTGPLDATLRLVHLRNPLHTLTVTGAEIMRVQFPSINGNHTLGRVKHGIVRLVPVVPQTKRRIPLRPGQRFEARLRNRELEGPYIIEVGNKNKLIAAGVDRNGIWQHIVVEPAEIAPRYETVASPDFGASFDVDAFVFREDQLRSQATSVGTNPAGRPIQDPLFGSLAAGVIPQLSNGAKHLTVFEQFICNHAQPDVTASVEASTNGARRRLTVLNISMCNQGNAHCVLDALVEFRRQNPDAEMFIVVSKLGPTEFQESSEFRKYVEILADNHIHVNMFTGADNSIRQVVHGKAIVVDDHVLFSTGSVMDTWPINKADFSIELPAVVAAVFRQYTDEAINGDATTERRAELAAELASHGVIINDPIAGLTYISRAQDALIRGASRELMVSISELVDPSITQTLISRAASGINVVIQVRELDSVSRWLLTSARAQYPNLQLEDSSCWEPRPHFNAIIADCSSAYVGTSYLWQTQRNMVHQGRSFENGVLLDGDAAASVITQINDLRARAYGADSIASVSEPPLELHLRVK